MDHSDEQKELCKKFGVEFAPAPADKKVGITGDVQSGARPLGGLRRHPDGDATGWCLWVGEEAPADDAFLPVRIEQLQEWCPAAMKFLGLPPGWRFIITNEYEDLWQDPTLV